MIEITTVSSDDELQQIIQLQKENHRDKISIEKMQSEGFVTMAYTFDELKRMHKLAPSIIAKDKNKVVAYALTLLVEGQNIAPPLGPLIERLKELSYKDKPLYLYRFYFMGQICIHKNYRGQGIFDLLYKHHRELYHTKYQCLITEISQKNTRSQKAHERVGFKTFDSYTDEIDDWNVVIWDWR